MPIHNTIRSFQGPIVLWNFRNKRIWLPFSN